MDALVTPAEFEDWCAGMRAAELGELASEPLFRVEAHTVDHPMLTACVPAERRRQVAEGVGDLERATGRPVRWVAYPSGDYDDGVLDDARALGLEAGFAVTPRGRRAPAFEIPRAGIYRPEPEVAVAKAVWARRLEWRG